MNSILYGYYHTSLTNVAFLPEILSIEGLKVYIDCSDETSETGVFQRTVLLMITFL